MRAYSLIQKLPGLFMLLMLPLFSMQVSGQEPVLKHAYTFDDGTAKDVIGDAHGILKGGEIMNGEYVAAKQGDHIELPAEKIKINTYSSFTLEAYLGAGHLNGYHTIFSYFGNEGPEFGKDYVYQSLSNGGNSVTSISCKNVTNPWSTSTKVMGGIQKDLKYHHLVTTLDEKELRFYIDGVLIGSNTNYAFPNNTIENLSDKIAYLCKSGFKADPTWFGTIDRFNIYEGVLDAATITASAKDYQAGTKELAGDFKEILSNVLENPGYVPEGEIEKDFLKQYKKAKFVVYPTIMRTVDSTAWYENSAQELTEILKKEMKLKVRFENSRIDPGELKGKGQLQFFHHDKKALVDAIKEKNEKTDYNIILEILYAPQGAEKLYVFGIHVYILDKEGESAFSFLLNSHHDYFSYNSLFTDNSDPENVDKLNLKCTRVAADALERQLEYAKE